MTAISAGSAPAVAGFLILMLVANLWVHVGPRRAQLLTGPLGALALLAIGRAAGLSWAQLGLSADVLLSGALVGAAAGALVAAALVMAGRIPGLRTALQDERYTGGTRIAVREALVGIPLSTVVFEETAFRSVLWGLLDRDAGPVAATLVSSGLFGVWHVLPALDATRTNAAARGDRPGSLGVIVLTVLATALAGVLLSEMRRRSGSLTAPAVLHWAANASAVLVSARLSSPRRPSPSGFSAWR